MNILPHEWDVLEVIRPLKEEHNNIWSIAEKLVDAVDASGKAKGMVVGSIARDTWISGDRDLDIFMMFAPSLSREEL
ncbi:MAG: CCA-adding protein, partial [Methanogenium sp.]|nr:CCA-adding protein [Methanogenium sp.]